MAEPQRLQKILAARGVASRRAAERLIEEGRISVNGVVVTELGFKADPVTDKISFDGHLLSEQAVRYIMLNKPNGFITTSQDERGRRTVMDLVDVRERVYPVGRLDRNTEGLLLLTNNGELANRIMHPRYEIEKEYEIHTPDRPSPGAMQQLQEGVDIEGTRVVPVECRLLREKPEGTVIRLVLYEGLHHVVRRMMDRVDVPVTLLRRTRVGPLSMSGILVGQWRDLRDGELRSLGEATGLSLVDA